MTKRTLAFFLTASLLFLSQSFALSQSAKPKIKLDKVAVKSAEQITAAQIKDYLSFIASDALEGRNTPSHGLDAAAQFIATLLSRWGYKPAGDENSYFQKIALKSTKVDKENTNAEINGQILKYGTDVLLNAGNGKASGSMVYVTHGWVIKSKNIDAYQNIDVKGKIVIVKSGFPEGVSFRDISRDAEGKDWFAPNTIAKIKGAVGVIVIGSQNWEAIRLRQERERFSLGQATSSGENLPSIVVSTQAASKLFEGETKNPLSDKNVEAFELSADKKVSISVAEIVSTAYTQNVVAVLEGSDPKLKNEYVALGAHYDHVGTNPNAPAGSDNIFNGADDDGSGTTALLAIAEAFAKSPKKPKRSIIFIWHTGEERGLWGSGYFVDHPTVPLENIVTQVNIDMIGRSKKDGDTNQSNKMLSGPNEIYSIGSRMLSTELGDLSANVNDAYLKLQYNYHYDQPNDPERLFYRSDHYNYAKKGIPIIFFFDGVHEDYHRVGDHVEKIDFQKMEKVTRTVFLTVWTIAELPKRPTVDKKLPDIFSR
jgi:hypothetical protein